MRIPFFHQVNSLFRLDVAHSGRLRRFTSRSRVERRVTGTPRGSPGRPVLRGCRVDDADRGWEVPDVDEAVGDLDVEGVANRGDRSQEDGVGEVGEVVDLQSITV